MKFMDFIIISFLFGLVGCTIYFATKKDQPITQFQPTQNILEQKIVALPVIIYYEPMISIGVFEITGYTPQLHGDSNLPHYEPDGITSTGVRAQRGICAVDPKYIPMGTRLYIPGYGECLAADKGGLIKKKKIDLCFDMVSEARKWGRKKVEVYKIQ